MLGSNELKTFVRNHNYNCTLIMTMKAVKARLTFRALSMITKVRLEDWVHLERKVDVIAAENMMFEIKAE